MALLSSAYCLLSCSIYQHRLAADLPQSFLNCQTACTSIGPAFLLQTKWSLYLSWLAQLRDLRLLDPQLALSYPSAILCREKALVVNLEHIKCIITTTYVLVLNADQENVIRCAPASPR